MISAWQEAASPVLDRVRQDLPTRQLAALRVVAMTSDADVGVADIAPHVARDAGLAARVLRAANSAHYGLVGRATTVHFAVSVIGFQTLRAIAAGVAAGLGRTTPLPDGYVERDATTAVAAQLLAPPAGADPSECYGVGLLHNLGDWLLHLYDPVGTARLRAAHQGDLVRLADAQHHRYGCTSGQLAAALLATWQLPARFVEPIGNQHDLDLVSDDAATIVLQAALALTATSVDDATELTGHQRARLHACGVAPDTSEVLDRIRTDASWITDLLR